MDKGDLGDFGFEDVPLAWMKGMDGILDFEIRAWGFWLTG